MMAQHLVFLCSWNSVICFIPFQWFFRQCHGLSPSWVVINNFKVLLSHQQANQRDVLIFTILTVDLTAAGPDKFGVQRTHWQPGCPAYLMIKPFFRTLTSSQSHSTSRASSASSWLSESSGSTMFKVTFLFKYTIFQFKNTPLTWFNFRFLILWALCCVVWWWLFIN